MRLFANVLGWALANVIVGGMAFAVVGACCGAVTGFILGFFFGSSLESASGVAFGGAMVGVACGILSIPIHFIYALFVPPDEFLQPSFDLIPQLARGQMWGTLIALAGFFALELISSKGVGLAKAVERDAITMVLFAPALMIMGAIIAAILKRD